MKFGRIVLEVVNMHRLNLTELDFRFDNYDTFKVVAMMSFQAEKCCHIISSCHKQSAVVPANNMKIG